MVTPHARLGDYELLAPLGAGGMGEVWRALDTRLGREVALKLLPDSLADDAARLSRFEREAKLLAAVRHPGIATLLAVERVDGRPFLVLELIEGPTLADRLQRGALPWKEAVEISRHIADALEAAHEKGVVHRDVKPSNVKVSTDDQVKLLDFGLGKAVGAKSVESEAALSTETSPTEIGTIFGTAPYMSPEQARGEAVDARTDIWAFGCVLYEMVTGTRAFHGRTPADVIARILEHEPDWTVLPPDVPPLVISVVKRCLAKDRSRRLHAIADARIELEEALTTYPFAAAGRRYSRPWLWIGATAALTAAAAGAAWMAARRSSPARGETVRLNVAPAPEAALSTDSGRPVIALSPDGRSLVYAAEGGGLYLRRLDGVEARLLAGTDGGVHPFFSADGRWVGFVAGGKLYKVSVDGGAPRPIADAPDMRGASWGEDGHIIFAPDPIGGLFRVSAEGGTPEKLTEPRRDIAEHSHRWPQVLPGGASVLFTIWPLNLRVQDARIAILSVKTGQQNVIVHGGTHARYLPSGHLVYGSLGTLFAAPFDIGRLEVSGPAVPVVEDVRMAARASSGDRGWSGTGIAQFTVSATGTLGYVTPRERPRTTQLLWIDRSGSAEVISPERKPFRHPSLSPDGRRLAVSIDEADGGTNLWIHDRDRRTWSQLTLGKNDDFPSWSPRGDLLAFSSNRSGLTNLFVMPGEGGPPRQVAFSDVQTQVATGWSPDGRKILFRHQNRGNDWDLSEVSLADGRIRSLVLARGYQGGARLSPDGRWMTYVSSESGRAEVCVRPYDGRDAKWTVSAEGGFAPRWGPDGSELIFVSERSGSYSVLAVPVTTATSFRPGVPRLLFERHGDQYGFDAAGDGQHFVVAEDAEAVAERRQIVIVPDWFDELRAKVPVPK
jgi:serine/threonine-protein kinase